MAAAAVTLLLAACSPPTHPAADFVSASTGIAVSSAQALGPANESTHDFDSMPMLHGIAPLHQNPGSRDLRAMLRETGLQTTQRDFRSFAPLQQTPR